MGQNTHSKAQGIVPFPGINTPINFELSAATKQSFGVGSVLQLQSEFFRDTNAVPDRREGSLVALDVVELLSEAELEKQWIYLEKRADVVPHWKRGVWNRIFGNQSNFIVSVQVIFVRPSSAPCPGHVVSDVEGPIEKLWITTGAGFLKQFVSSAGALSWKDTHDAKLLTVVICWYDLVLRFSFGLAVKDQFSLLDEVSDWMRVLRKYFYTKSPLTLIERANSLQWYLNLFDSEGSLFPGDMDALYKLFCMEWNTGGPASWRQAVVEALRFTENVLVVAQLGVELSSARVVGASELKLPGHVDGHLLLRRWNSRCCTSSWRAIHRTSGTADGAICSTQENWKLTQVVWSLSSSCSQFVIIGRNVQVLGWRVLFPQLPWLLESWMKTEHDNGLFLGSDRWRHLP